MFIVDFKPDCQEWAGVEERKLLLDMSRRGEIGYSFERVIEIRMGEVDLSPGGYVPVFGFISEIAYGFQSLLKGDPHTCLDVDGFPVEVSRDKDSICLATYSWEALSHSSQKPEEDGAYVIGTACVPFADFGSAMIGLSTRFRKHLYDLYVEAGDSDWLDELITASEKEFQVSAP